MTIELNMHTQKMFICEFLNIFKEHLFSILSPHHQEICESIVEELQNVESDVVHECTVMQ